LRKDNNKILFLQAKIIIWCIIALPMRENKRLARGLKRLSVYVFEQKAMSNNIFFSKLRAIIFSIRIKALYLQTENDKSTTKT